jgi:hypothetical protein
VVKKVGELKRIIKNLIKKKGREVFEEAGKNNSTFLFHV